MIREAKISDVQAIHDLIVELAIYEKEPDAVDASVDDIKENLFGPDPVAYCHVAEVDGQVVGIAIWFLNYSTWLGKAGLYLEDLFVKPEFRGSGLGLELMKTLAQLCVDRNYERFQWWVLDWNEPSINFYKSIGAEAMDEWTVYRLSGSALKSFAASSTSNL
ncbi:MAG: GNAT family N-acetyltransferase [Actinomycetales bacterium]|nr:GNAT family N-acetyltransferase [Actinomycetales bacterium]